VIGKEEVPPGMLGGDRSLDRQEGRLLPSLEGVEVND
jgi:hypothetical protein